MNSVQTFLTGRWQSLGLDRFAAPSALAYVALTPRFRASAHVVVMVLHESSPDPVLVVKMSRLPGPSSVLDREARNLRIVQASRPGGFASIPRLLAYEAFAGTQMLVQTAVAGQVLDSRMVRRKKPELAERLLAWTIDLHRATARAAASHADHIRHLLQAPLAECRGAFRGADPVVDLVERTLELTAPLARTAFPLAFAHGDLSAPNILASPTGQLGVVDWELGEPQGLPGQDLFFALTYLACASRRASRPDEYVAAFHDAFFGREAWAQRYVERYARRLRIPGELLKPLFLASWALYVRRTLDRVGGPADPNGGNHDATRWLVQSRFVALWRHAVTHWAELELLPRGVRMVS
jgi:aminoglycoside phosphotransferase